MGQYADGGTQQNSAQHTMTLAFFNGCSQPGALSPIQIMKSVSLAMTSGVARLGLYGLARLLPCSSCAHQCWGGG